MTTTPTKVRELSAPQFNTSTIGGVWATCTDQWGTLYRFDCNGGGHLTRYARGPEGKGRTVMLTPRHPDYDQVRKHLWAFATPEAVGAYRAALGQTVRTHAAAPALYAQVKEVLELCALGDVDETTEVHGWGDLIKAMRATVAAIEGTKP